MQNLNAMSAETEARAERMRVNVRELMMVSLSMITATMSAATAMLGEFSRIVPTIISSAISSTVSAISSIITTYYALSAVLENPGMAAAATAALSVLGTFVATSAAISVYTSDEMKNLINDFTNKLNWAAGYR